MPNPVQQQTEGLVLQSQTLGAGQPVTTNSFEPIGGQTAIKFLVNMTQAGTIAIYRVDELGNPQLQTLTGGGTTTTITANSECRVTISNPAKTPYYAVITNTSGSSATVYCSVFGSGASQ